MCGIAISVGLEKSKAEHFVNRANQLMVHRGPDGQGVFLDDDIALAHRRLAILDLSEAGAQPMHTQDERYVIVHNGEIYNHLDLRKRFLPDYLFKGHSDTETLLALYALQGKNMLSHLVGMWAFGIWDKTDKKLFISRDRYGQKPLYWRKNADKSLVFASEIKPLLFDGEKSAMNPTAVVEYLALGNYGHLGDQTFFKDILHFPAAAYAEIAPGHHQFEPVKFWDLPNIEEKNKTTFGPEQQITLRNIIDEAVQSQLLSDVNVGATLSGGLDSSTIVGAMADYKKSAFPVFTAQTSGSKYDESVYVNEVEKKWGKDIIQLHRKELENAKISSALPEYIGIQEEPFGDPSILAHGFLMDMAKENGVKVIIGGQGGDELFFGYRNMTNNLLSVYLSKFKFGAFKSNIGKSNIGKAEFLRIVLGAFLPSVEKNKRKESREKRRFFLKENILKQVDDTLIKMPNSNSYHETWDESIYRVHLPHLVHYDDRNAMSRSIEGRTPFLDHRIADFLATLKVDEFFKNGESKTLLRKTCSDLIPEKVIKRKDKLGFFTPIHEMLSNEIDWVESVILDEKELHTIVDMEIIKSDIDFYRSRKIDNDISRRLWRVLSFCIWKKQFNISI